jgi:hypothetical protein
MNRQEQRAYAAMLRAGMMPLDAEDAIRDAADAYQALPTEAEMAADATVSDADVVRVRQWFITNPAVPLRLRRLLGAVRRATRNR